MYTPSKVAAITILIGLLSVVILLHLAILLQLIPYDIVWAGKIDSLEAMYLLETVSLILNGTLMLVLYLKLKHLKQAMPTPVVDVILWIYVVVFGLNSLGNLFAQTLFELIFGTLFTLVMMYLCWVVVKKESYKLP